MGNSHVQQTHQTEGLFLEVRRECRYDWQWLSFGKSFHTDEPLPISSCWTCHLILFSAPFSSSSLPAQAGPYHPVASICRVLLSIMSPSFREKGFCSASLPKIDERLDFNAILMRLAQTSEYSERVSNTRNSVIGTRSVANSCNFLENIR